jgi:SAM-dependent methyltransferase
MSRDRAQDRSEPTRSSAHLERYREGLLNTPKYAQDKQYRLKRRAFATFDTLLRNRGQPGLRQGTRLLDLGAGDGSFVTVCGEAGLEARGLDISDGVNFEHDALPLDDGSIDVVTAISVIEHLYSPASMLDEVNRVLRPGGALILVCPNWRYSMKTYFNDPTHVHPYSEISLRQVLSNFGFSDVYVVPWLVCKPAWLWDLPRTFFVARWLIPFRGDAPAWIPGPLKGKSASLLAMAISPRKG